MLPKVFIKFLVILTLATTLIPIIYRKTSAETLSATSILLQRNAPSTPTTFLICATTPQSDNGVENNVKITFPSSFIVSTNTANWTVNTTSIPSDASAWPGIAAATSITGKTVTFPSSNLSTNTKYCFRTSNSNSLTTASTPGSHKGAISTYQGPTLVDLSGFGISVGSDQIEINAVVPASSTDFEADMQLTSSSNSTFPQNTVLTYTLTYGSQLTTSSNITVEAQWSLGTVSGAGSPSVEVLDYVIGSASNGYNSAPPVIDSVNRKIIWTINSFPPETSGATVTFQLKTNDNYTGEEPVGFDVSGRVIGPGTQTPDSTVTKNYQYNLGITPTATPTDKPSDTSTEDETTITPTLSPSPTLTPDSSLNINAVEIRGISPTTADIFIRLNKNATVALEYGMDMDNLSQTAFSDGSSNEYLIFLKSLAPTTRYYFRIIASNTLQTVTSEVFTFMTSESQSDVNIQDSSFIVISNNLLLYDQSLVNEKRIAPVAIIPTNSSFTFSLAFENSEQILSIQAFLRKKFASSQDKSSGENIQNISLIQTRNGEYTGRLAAGTNIGDYELFIRISDTLGNIFERKAADFRIVRPFTVLEFGTGRPVEGSKIRLFSYNNSTRIYEELNESNLPVKNPEKTLTDGTSEIILPQGRYRAEISAFLYEDQTVEFILGEKTDEIYPTVYMEKAPFSLVAIGQYLLETASNYHALSTDFINRLNSSNRLFELTAFISISIFILATFVSLLFRTQNSIKSSLHYLSHVIKLGHKNHSGPSKGIIKDKSGKEVPKAQISFIKDHEVVFQTSTNINGVFFTGNKDFDHIEISKVGYESATFPFSHQIDENNPTFYIEKPDDLAQSILHNTFSTLKYMIGLLFEVLVILLFVLELLFIPTFGILKTLPFLIITGIMLFIYIQQGVLKSRYL